MSGRAVAPPMAAERGISRTLRRYLALVRHIPAQGRRIGTDRLMAVLAGEGLFVSARTLQRDLETLQVEFIGLCCDDRSKPYSWYWREGAAPLGVPLVGIGAALAHDLVHRHLIAALPRTLVRALEPSFAHARKTLDENPDARFSHWSRRIRALPMGLTREPPAVRGPAMEVVYESLYLGHRFEADYKKGGAPEPRPYEVNPLGLVLRDGAVTLVCTFWDYAEVNHLSLHRIRAARSMQKPVTSPRGFNLDEHIRSGKLGFLVGPPLMLKARVQAPIAERLEDIPIDKGQRLSRAHDGWCNLEARVNDSMELRGWLRSLGPLIEVIGPKTLRAAMAEDASALRVLYGP
jgi:predicted DNA-binding transcriptional regulator YafY